MNTADSVINYLESYQRKARRSKKIMKEAKCRRRNEQRRDMFKLKYELSLCDINTISTNELN